MGLLVWAAGPALSSRPYVPAPVEFELSAAAPAHAASARAAAASQVLRPGKRFNIVGFRWRGSRRAAISIRTHEHGRWSRWTSVPFDPDHGPDAGRGEGAARGRFSDPVWVGDADALQYSLRARGRVRALRIHFVNTMGTATAFDRLRSKLRHAAAGAVTAVASLVGVRAARAQGLPGEPPIITREQWGASQCPPRATPAYGTVQLAFIHHTVTTNDYGPGDSAAMVRGICLYHRNSNGWNDIGYNVLVDKYGQIFEGRAGGLDAAVVGAQAQGYNSQSTGISNLGTFSTTGQSEAGLGALAKLLGWKLALHGVPPTGKVQVTSGGGASNRFPAGALVTLDRISGHRDADGTACPGDALYAQLPRLRAMVPAGPLPAVTSLAVTARAANIQFGSKAELTAALRGPDGAPVAGARVELQLLGRFGSWSTIQALRTGATGSVATRARLAYNHALRARFAGGSGYTPAQSQPIRIGVRPRVGLRLQPSSATVVARGARVLLRGRVKPAKRFASLLVDRVEPRGGSKRVARRVVRVHGGRARATFVFARRGSYALRFLVRADTRNLTARSEAVAVRVR